MIMVLTRDVLIIVSAIGKWPMSFVNRLIGIGKNHTQLPILHMRITTCINTLDGWSKC